MKKFTNKLSTKTLIYIALVLVLLIAALGSYVVFVKDPTTLKVSTYDISDELLPDDFGDFKVCFFSDVCIEDDDDIQMLEETVDKINEGNYDLICFGGDLFYDDVYNSEEVQELLSQIEGKYGKFAVLGEKDLLTSSETISILELGGFEVLQDEAIPVYYKNSAILLIGLESDIDVNTLINPNNQGYYKLVLVHQPDTFTASQAEDGSCIIDLQLSGHSYGGYYYLPLIDISEKRSGATTYVRGKYTESESTIIVSNGVNNEPDHDTRLFCSPNIVEVTFE